MNTPSADRHHILQVVVELARELPPHKLAALSLALESLGEVENLDRFAETRALRDKLLILKRLCSQHPEITPQSIGFGLRAAADAATAVAGEQGTDIAWTGPATEAVPLRRVDQVIYDMIDTANREVLLVTYAAYKAERALEALRNATDRGVRARLVIELAEESGGKISFDGLQAFRAAVPSAQIFHWPSARRTRSASGSFGAMHAKCLVADRRRAIVSSANLTDYALEVNMELGLVAERAVADRLAEHFDQLIVRGELTLVP